MTAAQAFAQDAQVTRATWYPTLRVDAVRQDVANRKPGAFTLLGKDIVLWAVDDGPIIAQEDRCAHEDAELATGYCRNGTLICAHHGWTHDPDGTSRPPGARNWKEPPKGWLKIGVYRTVEHGGYVWVALEDPGRPPQGDIGTGVASRVTLPPARAFEIAVEAARAHAPGIAPRSDLTAGDGVLSLAVTPMKAQSSQIVVFGPDDALLTTITNQINAAAAAGETT